MLIPIPFGEWKVPREKELISCADTVFSDVSIEMVATARKVNNLIRFTNDEVNHFLFKKQLFSYIRKSQLV